MKPPARSRPGFSRRAQYGLFAGYVVAVAGVFGGLGLIAIQHFDPQGFAGVKGTALDLSAPLSAAGRGALASVGDAVDGVGAYVDAGNRNRAMAAELARDRQALVRARILALENARLRRALRLVETRSPAIAVARIIGSTGTSSRRLATLNAGSRDGVAAGQPVRAPEGLVGRVIETGLIASRVLLITDNASVVPVRLARGGMPALAAGRGDGTLELRPRGAGANPFSRGDIVLSSGTGGLYPPDVPVAVVLRRRGDVAIAAPLADPARLDYAIVEPPFVGLVAPPGTPPVVSVPAAPAP